MNSKRLYRDDELILLLKQKQPEAIHYLYERYAAPLYSLVKQFTRDEKRAEELMPDILIMIIKSIDRYEPQHLRLFTWMMQVTRLTTFEKLKEKESRRYTGPPGKEDKISGGLISVLQKEEQQVLRLAYLEGHTIEEVASKLGLPSAQVKIKIRNAVVALKTTIR